jgi:NAD(P)-dependent dehydrogenase (short-subunit alcohol dehydrogenase family)
MKPVCLITGAGGRLGQALCDALKDRYDLIATYRHTVPLVSSRLRRRVNFEKPSQPEPSPVLCVQADLSQRNDIARLVEVSLARYGRVDAIVNAAADTHFHGPLIELWQSDNAASSQLLVNSVAPVQLVSAIHYHCWKDEPEENAHRNRNVINISSRSALEVQKNAGQGFYSASKAALNMLTLYLSLELAPYSVRANAVCPGAFKDQSSTALVVQKIQSLLEGDCTGTVV